MARKHQLIVEKQKLTGGGSLTKQEQRIINSRGYLDLALKLGISASGNEPRADSDAQPSTSSQSPTVRLRNILDKTGSRKCLCCYSNYNM